jgi:transcriptional regulator with PAS, ATPase and Fis domain
MNKRENQPSGDGHHLAAGEALQESLRLLVAFTYVSALDFVIILDDQLRYRAVNDAAADTCGVPAEAFVGNTVRDIFGPFADRTHHALRRVLTTGQPVLDLEAVGQLPTRRELGYWIVNYFPIKSRTRKVMQVGAVIVEVTKQNMLEEYVQKLAGSLVHTRTKGNFWLARELTDAINQYHAALAMSLDLLIRQPEKNTELLPQVELLDQRIVTVRTLVSDVADHFPIDQQF